MDIQFTTRAFKEDPIFVAHTPELDVSSCGETEDAALKNLKTAVTLFLEESEKLGTLSQILEEAELVSLPRVSLPLPLLHVKEA